MSMKYIYAMLYTGICLALFSSEKLNSDFEVNGARALSVIPHVMFHPRPSPILKMRTTMRATGKA